MEFFFSLLNVYTYLKNDKEKKGKGGVSISIKSLGFRFQEFKQGRSHNGSPEQVCVSRPGVRCQRLSYSDATPGSEMLRLCKGPLELLQPNPVCETFGDRVHEIETFWFRLRGRTSASPRLFGFCVGPYPDLREDWRARPRYRGLLLPTDERRISTGLWFRGIRRDTVVMTDRLVRSRCQGLVSGTAGGDVDSHRFTVSRLVSLCPFQPTTVPSPTRTFSSLSTTRGLRPWLKGGTKNLHPTYGPRYHRRNVGTPPGTGNRRVRYVTVEEGFKNQHIFYLGIS